MQIRAGMLALDAAECFGDRIALGSATDGISYRELDEAANRLASGLSAHGIQAGDRLAVISYNRRELLDVWLGCERGAFARVVMHSHIDMALHAELLDEVGATTVVFDTRFTAALAAHRGALPGVQLFVAIGEDPPTWALPYEQLLAAGDPQPRRVDVDENAPVVIQPTTGTTGTPKPWIVTHRSWTALVAHNLTHLDTLAERPLGLDDVNLHVHALQWASGAQTLLPYMMRGARTVLIDDATFAPATVAQTILDEQVTGLLMPGPMLIALLDVIEAANDFDHRLRRLVTLFATPELLERTTRVLGPIWCHAYGATEQGAPATRLTAAEAARVPARIRSVGRPASPFIDVAIVDRGGDALPRGEVGEIVVRSAMSNSSYWNDAPPGDESTLPGGWFRSHDLGYVDDGGFLHYVDRARDAIETAQGTVFPHEIEAAVLRHDAVANCGAVGLGERGSQRVVAAVVLKRDHRGSPELLAEIELAAGAGGLAEHARPRVLIVGDLPTVLGGAKVQRDVLRDELEAAPAGAR